VSIRTIADIFGEACGALACWTPEDPSDLFDYWDVLPDMLSDLFYALDRNTATLEATALDPKVIALLEVTVRDVGHAEGNAAIARQLGGWRP
jgi:hypothetical protein